MFIIKHPTANGEVTVSISSQLFMQHIWLAIKLRQTQDLLKSQTSYNLQYVGFLPPKKIIHHNDIEKSLTQLPTSFRVLENFISHNPGWGSKNSNT